MYTNYVLFIVYGIHVVYKYTYSMHLVYVLQALFLKAEWHQLVMDVMAQGDIREPMMEGAIGHSHYSDAI